MWIRGIAMGVSCLVGIGCGRGQESPTADVSGENLVAVRSNPAISQTLQAGVALTAAWVATISPAPTQTPGEPLPTPEPDNIAGTPPYARTGTCPVPDGYRLHQREGFCVSAPQEWSALNVDGGIAGFLWTTPGQAISLKPDWVASTEECNLLIYIANVNSSYEHLDSRWREFTSRGDLVSLSPVQMQAIGDMGLPGFTWADNQGGSGGIYAALLGPSRLIHIGYGGSNCVLQDILPALETLRFN